MNMPAGPSLVELAAARYDLDALFRAPGGAPVSAPAAPPPPLSQSAPRVTPQAGSVALDWESLRARGFVVPDGPPSALTEELRIVKRQLLLNASGGARNAPIDRGRMILICSAQPNEGKTFTAVNLALSLASERDTEVLLIDADVAKPEILSTLGMAGGPGLMDAIADPAIDVERLVIHTDLARLSVLPAGRAAHNDTELLASARTRDVFARLAERPDRIVIMDSAPALAASPASVLALHVGQVLMVVRADQTTEAELEDALALVDGCPHISLVLNATTFTGGTRRFGSYYGYER